MPFNPPQQNDPLRTLFALQQMQQFQEQRQQAEEQRKRQALNMGLELVGQGMKPEAAFGVLAPMGLDHAGQQFLTEAAKVKKQHEKLTEAKKNLPALAAAGTPAQLEGGRTQYAPGQASNFAVGVRGLSSGIPEEDRSELLSQLATLMGAGAGQQGAQVAGEQRREAQNIRAGQRAEGRSIRAEQRAQDRQLRVLAETQKEGRTLFERNIAHLPPEAQIALRERMGFKQANSADGFFFTGADGTTFASGDIAIKKQEMDVLDSYSAATETSVDLGKLISIIEDDPTVAGAIGGVRNTASNVVGVLRDLGKQDAASMVEGYVGTTLTMAASDEGIPEAFRDEAQSFLIDPDTRGTLAALEFVLTYSQVRASRQGRPSERDFERAKNVVGIRGFRESEQVLSTLKQVKKNADRQARVTKTIIDQMPGVRELAPSVVEQIRSTGPQAVEGQTPTPTPGLRFILNPETGEFEMNE